MDPLHIDRVHSVPIGPLADKNVITTNSQLGFELGNDGIANVDFSRESVYNHTGQLLELDRRFDVYSIHNGEEKTRITIGRLHKPCRISYILEVAPSRAWPLPPLQPAFAGSESSIVDRNFTAALSAANSFFMNGNEARLQGSFSGQLHALRAKPFDPTRFVFKLAQMWWYHVLAERSGFEPNVRGAIEGAVHINSIAKLTATLTDGMADNAVVFVDLTKASGQEDMVLSVLRKAAGNIKYADPGDVLPSILTKDIPLGTTAVYYTASAQHNVTQDSFHSNQVWVAASTWCAQYGLADLLEEQVRFIGTLLHTPNHGLDPIYGSQRLHLALPLNLLSACALTPLSVACGSIDFTELRDAPNPTALLSELVLHNQVMSAAFSEVVWSEGLGLARRTQLETEAARRFTSSMFNSARTPCVPALAAAANTCHQLGIAVGVSRGWAKIRPAGEFLKGDIQGKLSMLTAWEEVYDVFEAIPSTSLAALIRPRRASRIVQTDLYYEVADLIGGTAAGTFDALYNCGFDITMWSKSFGEINYEAFKASVTRNYRGAIADRPLPNTSLISGKDIVVTCQTRSDAATVKLYHHREGESSWAWYKQVTAGGSDSNWAPDWHKRNQPDIACFIASSYQNTQTGTSLVEPDIPPDSTRASERAFEERARETALQAITAAALATKPAEAAGRSLPKTQADRLKRCRKYLSGGVWGGLFNMYEESYDGSKQAEGMTETHYFNAIVPTVSTALAGISLATALPPIPYKERSSICKDIAAMCRRGASLGNNHVATEKFCAFAVKAENLASAMAVNPAVSVTELKELGFTLPEEAADLDDMAPAILEFGGVLADYAGIEDKLVVAIDNPTSLSWDNLEANGFKRSKNQNGLQKGEVRMEKLVKGKHAKKEMMDFYMSMDTDQQQLENKINQLVDILRPPPEKPATYEQFKSEYFHGDVFDPDLTTRLGQTLKKWEEELRNEGQTPLDAVPTSWEDRAEEGLDFPQQEQGGIMPPVQPPAVEQADVPVPASSTPALGTQSQSPSQALPTGIHAESASSSITYHSQLPAIERDIMRDA